MKRYSLILLFLLVGLPDLLATHFYKSNVPFFHGRLQVDEISGILNMKIELLSCIWEYCMGVIGTFDKRRCFAIFKEPES